MIKWLNKNRPCISMTCNKENADNINIAIDKAIKALHIVDIINEELSSADEDKAIWFDIPYWEEIQERADMRKRSGCRRT